MCFFNLHKSFSTPHGCSGPAVGAVGVLKHLEPFMPAPLVDHDGRKYYLNYDFEDKEFGVGKIRSFYGVSPVVLKAYAWIRSMGPDGLYQVAKTAVLNNNYLFKKLMELDVVDAPYTEGKQRVEQVRYTLEKLLEKTGISSADVQRRMMDFGMHIWQSHHPFYIPEPLTLEPTETPSKEDLDEYIATLKYIFEEAEADPENVKSAPHRSVCHQLDESGMDDPDKWAITWRSYLKKYK
jgi:glycine dehydrogenase subunit 2